MVNDETLAAESDHVVTLLSSATPYCVLTKDSRVPNRSRVQQGVTDMHVIIWDDIIKHPEERLCKDEGLVRLRTKLGTPFLCDAVECHLMVGGFDSSMRRMIGCRPSFPLRLPQNNTSRCLST